MENFPYSPPFFFQPHSEGLMGLSMAQNYSQNSPNFIGDSFHNISLDSYEKQMDYNVYIILGYNNLDSYEKAKFW